MGEIAFVLVVEDEPDVLDILEYLFASEGYEVATAHSAEEAWEIIAMRVPDAIVLDVELPEESGLEFCRKARPQGIPVIMVSCHDRDDEVIAGLETGADDYVRKPFNNRELVLRVGRILEQRSASPQSAGGSAARVSIGDLLVDRSEARVWRGDREIHLSPTEWKILDLLISRRGQPQSVKRILEHVWHVDSWIGGAEMVKVNIRRLRKKIEPNPREPVIVLNRRGRGYLVG
ncbi:MAG: response regulator transcription factor [Alkalispirochaeta sp.]